MHEDGFTQTANAVAFDHTLSLQARAVYTMLLHVAWKLRPERDVQDILGKPVPLPPYPELAEMLHVPAGSLRRFLNELRRTGYILTERPRKRQALIYRIYARPGSHEAPSLSTGGQTETAESDHGWSDYARASVELGSSSTNTEGAKAPSVANFSQWDEAGPPPALPADDEGQVEVINALASVAGVTAASPRMTEVAVAIHGLPKSLHVQPGINRLFWLATALRTGRTLPEVRARAAANPDGYQRALAAEIRCKAGKYERVMGGAHLTPGALAKWWADLDGMAAQRKPRGMTPDEIRAAGRARRAGAQVQSER